MTTWISVADQVSAPAIGIAGMAAAGLLEAVAVGGSSVEKTFRLTVALSQSMSGGFDDGAAYRNSGDGKATVGLREIIFGGW